MSDLDRLIEKHPEIMYAASGVHQGKFAWQWIPKDRIVANGQGCRDTLIRGMGGEELAAHRVVLFRDGNQRFSYLVAAWRKDYLVSTEEKPKFGSGAKYLPSGRLVEWELDAAGAPMKLTVDGEPVPAEFLSGAKRVTIVETEAIRPEC